jgi:hypothetical protein
VAAIERVDGRLVLIDETKISWIEEINYDKKSTQVLAHGNSSNNYLSGVLAIAHRISQALIESRIHKYDMEYFT